MPKPKQRPERGWRLKRQARTKQERLAARQRRHFVLAMAEEAAKADRLNRSDWSAD